MNWTKADIHTLREIVRAAEAYLDAQLHIATSSDQRGSTLASAFILAGAAVAAGLVTLASTSGELGVRFPIYFGGAVAAVMFLGGALFCILAAFPVDFYLPGNLPRNWQEDVESGRSLEEMLGDQAENYQGHITRNDRTLRGIAKGFKCGALIGVAAPFAGFVVWLGITLIIRFATSV